MGEASKEKQGGSDNEGQDPSKAEQPSQEPSKVEEASKEKADKKTEKEKSKKEQASNEKADKKEQASGDKVVASTEKATNQTSSVEKATGTENKTTASTDKTSATNTNTSVVQVDEAARGEWDNQVEFILSCIGLAVGLGNIWRFPSMAYENGGSAFLFPYLCCTVLFALPMVYAEFIIGQFTKSGPAAAFKHYAPAFQGIGWSMVLISVTVSIYYTTIVAWSGVYLAGVVGGQSGEWTQCGHDWNNKFCNDEEANMKCAHQDPDNKYAFEGKCIANASLLKSPAEQFFLNSVLWESRSLDDIGGFNWKLFLSLFIMWALVAIMLCKGIDYMGKFSYVTSTAPYLIIMILFARAITLEGASNGVDYYLGKPDWSKVLDIDTWSNALKQICFSMNIGYGGLITLASYSKFSNNCFRDALIVCGGDTFMSVFGGVAVFSTLGFLSHCLNKPIEEVVQSGTALAFVAYPEAMAKMPISWLWSGLFFLMLFFLGISSEVALVETFCTAVYDQWPNTRRRKWLVVIITCTFLFVIGAVQATRSGVYWFTVYNEYTGSTAPCFVAALEMILLAWVYGRANAMSDVAEMRGLSTGWRKWFGGQSPYWGFNWMFISPILALVIMTFTLIRQPTSYVRGDGTTYNFPMWAEVFGWFLSLIPLITIPIYFVVNLRENQAQGKPFMDLFSPQPTLPSYQRIMQKNNAGDSVAHPELTVKPSPNGDQTRALLVV